MERIEGEDVGEVILTMKEIDKSFPGVHALDHVNLEIRKGEVHALMGENGAGKSTLIKVLTGVYGKDEGEIFIKGIDKAVSIRSPQDAQKLGISTVYQEITLCPNLSVAENMYIGRTSSPDHISIASSCIVVSLQEGCKSIKAGICHKLKPLFMMDIFRDDYILSVCFKEIFQFQDPL